MAVTYDTSNSGGTQTSGATQVTVAHTVAAQANAGLLGFATVGTGQGRSDSGYTVTATYNGSSGTSVAKVHSNNSTAGFVEVFWWPLGTGDGTAHDAIVTCATALAAQDDSLSLHTISCYGVDQATPTATTGFGSASPSRSVSSQTGSLVACCMASGAAISPTSLNQTGRTSQALNNTSAAGNSAMASAAGATTVTFSYTDNGDWWSAIGVNLQAATGGGNSGAPVLGNFVPSASGTVNNPPQVAYVKEVGFVTNTTSGTTSAITVAAGGVPVGDTVVVLGACDNAGSGGAAMTITVSDTRANTWATLTPHPLADPGAASAGIEGFIAWTVVATGKAMQAGDTITITYATAPTAKGVNAQQFTNAHASTPILSGSYSTQNDQSSTTTSVSTTPTAIGQAVVAIVPVEGGTADSYTQDSDTTDGSWVGLTRRGSGTTTSGATLNSVYKIVTGTSTQTYNPTLGTARDHAAAIVVINVNHSGAGSPTMGSFTSSASGSFTGGPTDGTAAITLGNFTASATGQVGIVGTSARTLAPFVPTASGTYTPPPITGTVAVTLGNFVALGQQALYPASISSRRILDNTGQVWLGKCFSSWGMAQQLSNSNITTALTAIHDLGFNAAQVACFGVNMGGGWSKYTNQAGNPVFATTNNGNTSTTAWTGELGSAWNTVDFILSEAAKLDITIILSFFLSVVITDSGVANDMEAATNANLESIGTKIGTRYASTNNLIYSVEADGDFTPGSTIGRRVDYLFKGIRSVDSTHFCFNEPGTDGTTYGQFIVDEGTDPTGWQWWHNSINGMYSYSSSSVDNIDGVYNQSGATTLAVWDSETPYANAPHYGTGGSATNRQNMRERNLSDFIRGFVAINYGDEDWWNFGASNLYPRGGGFDWTDVPTVTESVQAGYCWDLVDAYMRDSTWLPVSTFVTTGVGTGDTRAAVGASDTAAVAYFPSSRSVTVDTTIITGTAPVRLRWYDPTAGSYTTIASSEAQQSGRSVTYPSAHGDGSNDWALVVDLAPQPTGTVAATLSSFTSSASGTVTPPATTGSGSPTLGSFTPSASGQVVAFIGTSARTMGDFTPSATGQVGQNATASPTLAPFTATGSGNVVAIVGTAALTLNNFTSTTAGTQGETGSAAETLDSFVAAGTGSTTPPSFAGTVAVTLGSFTPSASGTFTPPPISGTSAQTLGNFTSTASGTFAPSGSGFADITLAPFTTTTTSGAIGENGSAAITLDPFAPSASGTFTPPPITGTASPTLGSFTSTATGAVGFTGTANPTLNAFTSTASGTVVPPSFTGTANPAMANFTIVANGSFAPAGSGFAAITLDPFTALASGTYSPLFTGTVAATLDSFTVSATGTFNPAFFGGVAVTLNRFIPSSSGTVIGPPEGFVDAHLDPFVAHGVGGVISGTVPAEVDILIYADSVRIMIGEC